MIKKPINLIEKYIEINIFLVFLLAKKSNLTYNVIVKIKSIFDVIKLINDSYMG